MAAELGRGYPWVGVSAQAIGVEGGPVAVSVPGASAADAQGKGLKALDPARYGSLSHPGDAYSYDMFTQVARALRASRSGGPLGDLSPQRVLAVGESQSAFTLTTYVDGVQPLTHAFDGFLLHSRGGAPAPLSTGAGGIDIASAISGKPTIVRTDTDVPVMIVETETDVVSILGYYGARQDDDAHIRLWEVAGTAHADAHLVGASVKYIKCGVPVNNGAMHIVAKAAWHDLKAWLATGTAPPIAPRIDATPPAAPGGQATIRRDADAIALGGIRTPPVDVPVAAVSGAPGPVSSAICLLLGSSKPFTDARLGQLYSSRKEYEQKFAADADKAINAGFVLAADRAALLKFAEPDRIPS
jgi:hypothetical protein